MALTVIRPVH